MKSAHQMDREMMAAWLKWIKAQEEAARAKAECDKAAFAMNKHVEEHEAKEAAGRKTEKGKNMKKRVMDTLQDITGKESGIVLYEGGDMLICNWASISGLPRLDPMGFAPLGLGDELTVDDDPQYIPDIGAWLDDHYHNLIYDINDDYPQLHGQSGRIYKVSVAQVITPDTWN